MMKVPMATIPAAVAIARHISPLISPLPTGRPASGRADPRPSSAARNEHFSLPSMYTQQSRLASTARLLLIRRAALNPALAKRSILSGFSLTPGLNSGILETLRGVAPGVCVCSLGLG